MCQVIVSTICVYDFFFYHQVLNPSSVATPAAFTSPIEKSSTEGRWRCRTKLSRCSFCIADWVVNICATFSLCTPLSCFLRFARPLPMFRWTWCQGLCMSSSHGCSWKMSQCDWDLSLWWYIKQLLEVLWVELIENYMKGLINSQKLLQCFFCSLLCSHFHLLICSSFFFKSSRPLLQDLMPTHSLKQVDRRKHE